MFDLCAVGELMWLTTLEVERFPKPGETTSVKNVQRMIGNDAAIVSIMASRMGLRVSLLSNPVSQFEGQALSRILEGNKVSLNTLGPTPKYAPTNFCLVDQTGNRTWLPPGIDLFPVLPKSRITSKLVYIDLYEEALRARLDALSELVRQEQRIFINLSATSTDDKLGILAGKYKRKISVIQFSSSQTPHQAQQIAARVLKSHSPAAVLITLGDRGSVICTQAGVSTIEGVKNKKILREMGAGATFSAGFIFGMTEGYTYQRAHQIASKRSTQFCTAKHDPLQ